MGQNHTSTRNAGIRIVLVAVELTKDLMAKYSIPVDRVVRHHDDITVSRIGGIGSQRNL
ncbi:hypothetical protein [Lacrimispora sphenoides]|uniref:hypothetical protein n=1 Tax=Lacrimispora sphenoides TaxID=29370 RepID=UPI001FA8673D|nr:hypothetical protein [Lacrimispora sphenoides]